MDDNLRSIYQIEQVPCDTYMRTVLNEVDPEAIHLSADDGDDDRAS